MDARGAALAARLAAASVRRPAAVVAVACLGVAVLAPAALRLESEVGYAAYFGPESREVARLADFLEEFESGCHVLVVFGCRDSRRCRRVDEPWSLDFLARLHGAAERLPNVRRVWSALDTPIVTGPLETRTLAIRSDGAGHGATPFQLDPAWPQLLAAAHAQRAFAGVLAPDARSAGVVVELASVESGAMRATVRALLSVLPGFEQELGAELHVAGDPVWTVISADSLARDSARLTALMFAVMLALLWTLLRDPWLAALPALAILAVAVAVQGIAAALGLPRTALLSALPPLLVVIAMAGSLHLLAAVAARAAGEEPARAIVAAARAVGAGCLWASLTTAVGFGSFLWSDLASFRHFGALAGLGVVIAFGVTFTLLPALLCLRLRRGALRQRAPRAPLAGEIVAALEHAVVRHPRFVLAAATAGFALLAGGVLRLHYAGDFGFGERSFVVRSLRAIEANFRKPMTTEVVISLPPGQRIWEPESLRLLEDVEAVFAVEPSTGEVWSLLDLLEDAHRVDFGRPPASPEALAGAARREMALVAGSERARWFWSESGGDARPERTRVSVDRAWLDDAAQGPYVARVRAALAALEREAPPGTRLELAGGLVLADEFVSQLRDTQWRSFASAFAVIAATLGWVLRDAPGLWLRAVAANVLPVLALLGLMGWAGIGIDPATAMVGAILLVLADDETIHLTLAVRDAQRAGASPAEAVARALRDTGEAILATGLCLALGFSVLLFSSWGGLVGFGLMASLGVGLLLAGGLLFLPASLLACGAPR